MSQDPPALTEIPDIGLPRLHRGKVRDVFAVGDDRLLLVTSDRLSAFDVVFDQGIPGKGRVLTQLSELWFKATAGLCANHLITTDTAEMPFLLAEAKALLAGRSMLCQRARRVDVECVVRGYISGSGWKEYQKSGTVCGIPLPPGLQFNQRLAEPIFTPALKNDTGHDENVSEARVAEIYGAELAGELHRVSVALYEFGAAQAAKAGIILADTKFEFGYVGERLTLIDELFTPDSSRFWPADRYQVGQAIDSLDKQPIRDFAAKTGWNLEPPAPELPQAVIEQASTRYQQALAALAGVLG